MVEGGRGAEGEARKVGRERVFVGSQRGKQRVKGRSRRSQGQQEGTGEEGSGRLNFRRQVDGAGRGVEGDREDGEGSG